MLFQQFEITNAFQVLGFVILIVFFPTFIVFLRQSAASADTFHNLVCKAWPHALKSRLTNIDDVASNEWLSNTIQDFELEKRAFFDKTWLFICHRNRFIKIGDYHTFEIAGSPIFVVLSKDMHFRAFHNVCRHRAYTVVRKTCGTSTRFSCKYHGWQYDDEGRLIKAPQFEESASFNFENNGLFDLDVIVTQEGLIFVNFDREMASNVPYRPKFKIELDSLFWKYGKDLTLSKNWKCLAQLFTNEVDHRSNQWSLFNVLRKQKTMKLFDPLTLLEEIDDGVWCTISLRPRSNSETFVRVDLYAVNEKNKSQAQWHRWSARLEQKVLHYNDLAEHQVAASFAYDCGGRKINFQAVLKQHERAELHAGRKLQSTLKFTGTQDIDYEAEALTNKLAESKLGLLKEDCPFISSKAAKQLEW